MMETEALIAAKKQQRKLCFASRSALTAAQRSAYSAQICEKLISLAQVQQAQTIFSYMAFGSEVDLALFHDWAKAQGKRLAFPICLENGRMVASVPAEVDGWESGKYGIMTPVAARATMLTPQEVDLILVPCVGFDDDCRRLGHGGGYYDRYLQKALHATHIMIAFEAQRLDEVVCEAHDLPVATVLTESTMQHCSCAQ
ncbi:MAG: 5-formyltetrahydrofolate cyclo-ligase [Ruminococcaceae bacterium]|nr:5-formyltetrahydrofolate cyclo-ligase [Oscillospiraceae bacterium]